MTQELLWQWGLHMTQELLWSQGLLWQWALNMTQGLRPDIRLGAGLFRAAPLLYRPRELRGRAFRPGLGTEAECPGTCAAGFADVLGHQALHPDG